MIKRTIKQKIIDSLYKNKIIILYGARQVGKTTLVKDIMKEIGVKDETVYYNCDEPDIRESFTNKTSTELKFLLSNKKLIIIDEAQRVKNIGITLKLINDNYPEIQIIATGSSSFDLSNKITEPLTGRKREFYLYPFSTEELLYEYDKIEVNRLLENNMVFGMYPEIISNKVDIEDNLKSLANSYAYKDILQFQDIRHPEVLEKLLQALALQVGSEVSYNELASTVEINRQTVANYIRILEKAFIIFRVGPFSRNLRSELKKLRKIYFYDNGIRNVIINNLNPLNLRHDKEALWENFIISERLKFCNNHFLNVNNYFWRTKQQQEIDYIEEENTVIRGYEFKWQKDKFNIPKAFSDAYPDVEIKLVNKNNYLDFVCQ